MHSKQKHNFFSQKRLIISSTLFLECTAAFLLFYSDNLLLWSLLIHLATVCLLLLWAITLTENFDNDRKNAVLLGLTTMVMGPVGVIGTLVSMQLVRLYGNDPVDLKNMFYESTPPSQGRTSDDIKVKQELESTTNTFASFRDILTYGGFHDKQAVIAVLARNYRPEFMPIIKQALVDSDANIRVQAATVMAKHEREQISSWITLEENLVDNDFDSNYALACHLDHYSYLGAFDKSRVKDIQKRALSVYMKCQALNPRHKLRVWR